MTKVGIAVGHYGPGTGASYQFVDEWLQATANADQIAERLRADGKLEPMVVSINQESHPWDLVQKVSKISPPSFLGLFGNIDIRYQWLIRDGAEAVIELHYNSSKLGKPKGHEVWVRSFPGPKTKRFGEELLEQLDLYLDNPNRGLRTAWYRVLRELHSANIPAAIIEPAFVWEDQIIHGEWQAKYANAVVRALYSYFNV